MGSAHRKKKRWRRLVIGGVAALALAWGGYQLSQVGGQDAQVSQTTSTTGDATRIGPGWRWGTLDATSVQSWDATQ